VRSVITSTTLVFEAYQTRDFNTIRKYISNLVLFKSNKNAKSLLYLEIDVDCDPRIKYLNLLSHLTTFNGRSNTEREYYGLSNILRTSPKS
jgi:hypothetical protein